MAIDQESVNKYVKQYTTEELLRMALTMLDEARKREAKSNVKKKWLNDNLTLEVIRAKVNNNS